MSELPSGTVTFLFTDIEGSTRLWQEQPEAMRPALARHDILIREAIESYDGLVVKMRGDGAHAAFRTASDAIDAAIAAQVALTAESWALPEPLRVRMGIHTGAAELRDGDYFGSTVNRAARLQSIAHGGQIVCSQATAELVKDAASVGVELVDLGEHRLRDLARVERVFQVTAPDLPTAFSPLRSLSPFPGNLPLPTSSFVGRERELARTIAALREARVVTLTGVGGVGKTRLAQQVAAEVSPQFPEGAWLVELAPLRDSDGVVDTVAAVFGVTAQSGLTLEQALIAFFRSKQMLLVVDNCEHVLEAAAKLVEQIESACADVVVLATSREGLAIDGERLLPVPSLPGPTPDADRDVAARSDAVRLFVERAQAHDPDFVLSENNVGAVVQVCRRLDGLPLAIELAAARIPTMRPSELAIALDRRLDVLAGGRRRAVKRHQTLRATIDWSHELLNEGQRRLLARLSVFAGGCTREAAEAVCGAEPLDPRTVFELLASLVAQSLVVTERDGPETRYRLLETIREYAEERLAEHGEVELLRDQHAAYYATFVDRYVEHVWGPDQLVCGRRLESERDNLLAAWSWALDTEDVGTAFRILSCAIPGAQIGYELWLPCDALLAVPGVTRHPDYALYLAFASREAALQARPERVERLRQEALEIDAQRPSRDPRIEFYVTGARAIAMSGWGGGSGGPEEIADQYERFVEVARHAPISNARMACMLAVAANSRARAGNPTRAAILAEEALTLARPTGMPTAIAVALLARGSALAESDPVSARACLDESLARSAALGYEQFSELTSAAYLASRLHDRRLTLELAARGIAIAHWLGQERNLAILFSLAGTALLRVRPEAAATMLTAAAAMNDREQDSDIDIDIDASVAFTLTAIEDALAVAELT